RMTTQSFENLDFSFLIETDTNIAYLQEWEDGNWGEAHRFTLPQPLHLLPKDSKLARALKSFRKDPRYKRLCSALRCGQIPFEPKRHWVLELWRRLQPAASAEADVA